MAELQETTRDDGVVRVAIVGKLDIQGLHSVDIRFHACTAARRRPTIVDLSRLDFIASLGVGMLVSCAQSMARYGARMVLLNPQPLVEQVLVAVGIPQIIPIVRSEEEGLKLVQPKS